MITKRKAVALLLPLVLFITGCKDPYGGCSKAGADISASITAGDKTVLQLEQSGAITKQEAINVLGYLEFANKGNSAFLTCAKAAHDNGSAKGSYTACATAFASTVNNPSNLSLIHVNNPQSQLTVTTIANGVAAGVSAIGAALGGA